METSVFRNLCVSAEHYYICTHARASLICGVRHLIGDLLRRRESASQRCVSCLLTHAKKTYVVPEAQSGLAVLCYRLREMLSVYTAGSYSVL